MNAIKNFLMENGLSIMIIGFVLFFSCFLTLLFAGRYTNYWVRQGAFIGAITGFSIYVIGRACVFMHNRKKKREPENLDQL
jgi:hypothetical protein